MEWNAIFQLIDPKLLIVVAVCWVLGFVLKRTPRIPDWAIIYIVMAIAILLAVWLIGIGPEAIINGILAGAFAVFGHQAIKQAKEAASDGKSD
ncbi:phage holin family protein [Cohnella cholangitidis]|uniref:Phage holin family Hol44, holin superfamily V n=1 Tax=Cohnella cholangitidis TaxID=2598458 RepID=A0A7G5C3H0_9BACL|nr:phage holin family protein [Cohnella cholangitidis]QMV43754.1 hypothetical protein FPL14_23200 [Cohnella cholangitidis]